MRLAWSISAWETPLDKPRDEGFRGDAGALRLPDGKTAVWWQRKQYPDEVERCLRELKAAS